MSSDLDAVLAGAQPAQYRVASAGGNRLGDTPARTDDNSRLAAQLASETGMAHINDVARRIRYNGAYFEIDVEVNRERGIVPVTWEMLRAHTPLVSQAYYARVYTSRGWSNGRQVPGFGPDVILPEAFTPELTPVIFDYFRRSFISWSRDFDGWTQAMAEAWLKTAAIQVAQAWTAGYVGGVAVTSVRASQITGRTALGAAAVPNAAAAARACAGGKCPCFVAGTPVATADGPIVIERVTVGQRVLPASPACADFHAGDAAALTEYHLQIRAADGDVFAIELLRPREWLHAPGARPGDLVYVELDEINVRGLALVTAWEPHPGIDMDSTRGCLVTGTVSHTATTLSVVRLQGDDEPIIATPWHRMYSHTQADWVAIEDVAAGELLRTADGTIAVESVVELGGQREPVFNLEVAGSHRYFVHGRQVLTHNTYSAAGGMIPRGFATPEAFRQFGARVNAGLAEAGYTDARALLQGSAVTGRNFRTGAAFDVERVSDFDVALASPTLLARARELGVGLRSAGTRTGPLSVAQVRQLGLRPLQQSLSQMAGRRVNFMIYEDAATAAARAPSIPIP